MLTLALQRRFLKARTITQFIDNRRGRGCPFGMAPTHRSFVRGRRIGGQQQFYSLIRMDTSLNTTWFGGMHGTSWM